MKYLSLIRNMICFFLIVLFFPSFSQTRTRYTISGYVYEKGSKETLIGANVYEPNIKQGATTNTYGFYAISLPSDTVEIIFSFVGYEPLKKKLVLKEDLRLDVELKPNIELEEFVVRGDELTRISQTTQMSLLDLPIQQARNIPSLLGERDMFKVLQLMPGVQSGTEGTSGFYVRGGGPDQNLIILDDAIVYNASHLFGFFSVFNGDAVKNMQLYKGGFPARFGGRLSSVLDIQMKDGSKEKLKGEAGIGLVSSRLTLEGPVIKDKASILFSGRRTYFDILAQPFMDKDSRGGYFFYDLNSKFNYDIDKNNRIFISGYFGRDKFYFRDKYQGSYYVEENQGGLSWQNATATLRWNHLFNEKLFANASLIFSDYTLEISSEENYQGMNNQDDYQFQLIYNSGIRDIGFKYDLSWHPSSSHIIRSGLNVIHHRFMPSALVLRDDDIGRFESRAEILKSLESAVYIEDEISFSDFLKINPGLRFSYFYANGKAYPAFEPRFASNLILFPQLSWKFSYAAMNQNVHLLSTTGVGLPTDLWVPSTDQIKPQKNWQLASGFAYDWIEKDLEFSLEGYYKKSDDIIGYKEGASFLYVENPDNADSFSWQDNITSGQAWSYGFELLLQKKKGRFSGWIGYTLSWTQQQFDELNFGEKFWARYDRRHDFSLVLIYEINNNITFSTTWVYSTGNAFDLATGRFSVISHPLHGDYYNWLDNANVYDKKNSFRAAPYHRLDISLQFHKDVTIFNSPVKRTIELGAYNAYSRKNPFFYYWREQMNYNELMQVSIFPVIPSISLNFSF